MSKRKYPAPDPVLRAAREKAFRQFRAFLEVYWSMCGTWIATEHHDPELARRMLAIRDTVLEAVDVLMPVPGGVVSEAEALPDQSRAVH
jgi:hypothetical protein